MLFKYFPLVTYDEHLIRDFTRHISFLESLDKNPYVYLPYTLQDGERPEDIAYHYYGDVKYTPYVLMANKVVNPYTDWLMTDANFANYFKKKYKEKSGSKGDDIIRWGMNRTRFDNIVYFENGDKVKTIDTYIDDHVQLDLQESYYLHPENISYVSWAAEWNPVRYYDWEYNKNEEKRSINLVDESLIDQVHSQFKDLIAA